MRNGLDIYRGQPSLFTMMSEFDRLFDRAIVTPWAAKDVTGDREWFQPHVEVQENDEAYFLTLDLPGVRKEDLKVDLNGRTLSISGERKRQEGSSRMFGKFSREITLPNAIDAEKIEANLEDGVLAIALPKAASAKPRAIEIGTGKPGFFSKLLGTKEESETKS